MRSARMAWIAVRAVLPRAGSLTAQRTQEPRSCATKDLESLWPSVGVSVRYPTLVEKVSATDHRCSSR